MSGDALIVEAVRTPIGRRKGMLSGWHPADLLSEVLAAVVERAGVDPGEVDDVIVGCLDQVGEQSANIARSAGSRRGVPRERSRDDDGSAVRKLAAGRSLRGPGDHGGGLRHRHRGRRRVDDARADVGQRPRPLGRLRPTLPGALRPGPRLLHRPGDLGRDDGRALRAHAEGARRVRRGVAPPRRGGHRRGPLRAGDPSPPRRSARTASGPRRRTRGSAPGPPSRRSPGCGRCSARTVA